MFVSVHTSGLLYLFNSKWCFSTAYTQKKNSDNLMNGHIIIISLRTFAIRNLHKFKLIRQIKTTNVNINS